jgi:hypothetical protein
MYAHYYFLRGRARDKLKKKGLYMKKKYLLASRSGVVVRAYGL